MQAAEHFADSPSAVAPDVVSASERDAAPHLRAEMVAFGYGLARVGVPAHWVGASVVTGLVMTGGPRNLAFLWFAAVSIVTIVRFVDCAAFARAVEADEPAVRAAARRWGLRFAVLAALSGLAWGAAVVLIYPAMPPGHGYLLLLVVAGALALGPHAIGSVPGAYVPYSLGIAAPIVAGYALGVARIEPVLALITLVFWVILYGFARKIADSRRAQFLLQYRNAHALAAASAANRELARLNGEIKLSEEKFKRLTRLSSDWYWEQDAAGRYTVFTGPASPQGMDPLGRAVWEVGGAPVEGDWEAHCAVMARREPFKDYILRWIDAASGEATYVSMAGEPRCDDAGVFLGYRGTAKDVTRLKRAEEAAARAQADAEAANAAKSQFLANMSHEIRTPMNCVVGMLDLLAESALDDEQRRNLAIANSSARALLEIINEILDFSKIEAGKLELERIAFDPHRVVEDVVGLLRPRVHEKSLAIDVAIDPRVPHAVTGDPVRVRQILTNLASNAVKFTSRGGVSVHLLPENDPAAGEPLRLRFLVRDTGIGISAEAGRHLFQPFTQADGSTSRRFGGTGLGLAISRQLAELMGGSIDFASTPGEGATFWFTVPFDLPDGPVAVQSFERTIVSGAPLAGGRVLVVEDNPVNRELAVKMLGRLGFEAAVAVDGAEGIARFRAEGDRFDLILMDCQMPGVDGFTATTEIRKLEAARGDGSRIPIVALTANALAGDRDRCLAAGMDDYVSKPFKLSTLRLALARWARAGQNAPG